MLLTLLTVWRTTSAYAENTRLIAKLSKNTRNYLRVRGEYNRKGGFTTPGAELPPRTRRIPATASAKRSKQGTTSAYAENTCKRIAALIQYWNYLRVRGEYPMILSFLS